jgi:hypothetical protein
MTVARLLSFKRKYGFIPHRELARMYWAIGDRAASLELQNIAWAHAMRVWPEIINS